MNSHDQITLAGMQFHTLIGVLAHDQQFAQPLEVDISVDVDRAMRDDRPVLDYRGLYASAARVLAAGPLDYLERAAERRAAEALALDGVVGVRVAVRKPHVALGGPIGFVQVAIERRRLDEPEAGADRV